MKPYFKTNSGEFVLYGGDCRAVVPKIHEVAFDTVFADPPYFLSNGGFSIQSGRCVSVDKGTWDKSKGRAGDTDFTYEWVCACREKMSDAATIWVCGTFHNAFTVANVLSELDFRILNVVTWQKTNPPPNLSCRFFTHSTEMLIWARKDKRVPHCYNYDLMHYLADGRQMTDVWRMPAIARWEKSEGKHPTQKPISLVVRALLSCTKQGGIVLDPFAGSSTTGVAANLIGRRFVGVELDEAFLELSRQRRLKMRAHHDDWIARIPDLVKLRNNNLNLEGGAYV